MEQDENKSKKQSGFFIIDEECGYVPRKHPGGRPKSPNPYKAVAVRIDQKTIDTARKRAQIENVLSAAIFREAVERGLKVMDDKYPEAQLGEGYPHEIKPANSDKKNDQTLKIESSSSALSSAKSSLPGISFSVVA